MTPSKVFSRRDVASAVATAATALSIPAAGASPVTVAVQPPGDGSDATDLIQSAIDTVEPVRGRVYIATGRYRLTRSLRLPSFVTLQGEGAGTILDNETRALNVPQLVNKDSRALIFATVRDLVFRGGTHAVKLLVSDEIAGLSFSNCTFELQTAVNFQVNKLLQTTNFNSCVFDGAPQGLVVDGFTANMNNFIGCTFTNHGLEHVTFNTAEVNNFVGCRFEGGGRAEGATIALTNARNINFFGCYFEATHQTLLRESKSANGVWFEGCHFTGWGRELRAYRFDSDGIIGFGANSWHVSGKSSGPIQHSRGTNGAPLGSGVEYFANTERYQSFLCTPRSVAIGDWLDIIVLSAGGVPAEPGSAGAQVYLKLFAVADDNTAAVGDEVRLLAHRNKGGALRVELVAGKVDPPFEYALANDEDGEWRLRVRFTSTSSSRARHLIQVAGETQRSASDPEFKIAVQPV